MITMAASARCCWVLQFLHVTAALQLSLSPCNRAPARRAGAPCMKYSPINDLSSLLTDAEVALELM